MDRCNVRIRVAKDNATINTFTSCLPLLLETQKKKVVEVCAIRSDFDLTNKSQKCLLKQQIICRQSPPAIAVLHRFNLMTTIHHEPSMSTTMTLTMSQAHSACPNCGVGLPSSTSDIADTQKQIEDLQAQVRLLTQKATAAGMFCPGMWSAIWHKQSPG